MSSSINQTLYYWMKEKRIIAPVAERLGIPYTTLVSELRSEPHQAKLGADRLVPLFNAIRDTQYAAELEGMLRTFVRELEGDRPVTVSAADYSGQVNTLMACVGELLKSTAQIRGARSARKLSKLKTMIRTEIIPAVYKLEDIVDRRLERFEKKPLPAVSPKTSQAGA